MKMEAGLGKMFEWKDVCKTVEFYRRSLNLSQNKLARLLGVMPSTVGVWERGIKEPRASSLVRLARTLNVSEIDLLHPSEEMKKKMEEMNL